MRHPKLTDGEISAHMTDLPGWAVLDDSLVRTYQFPDFAEAMIFVNEARPPRRGNAAPPGHRHPVQ